MTRMMKCAAPLLALALLTGAKGASAENVAALTCADLTEDNIVPLAIWLDGYRAAKLGSTRSDEDWMFQVTERLIVECDENPDGALFPMFDEMIRRY